MAALDFLVAFLLAVIFTFILLALLEHRHTRHSPGFFFYFILLLLGMWAARVWLAPLGETSAVSWLALFVSGVVLTVMLAIAIPAASEAHLASSSHSTALSATGAHLRPLQNRVALGQYTYDLIFWVSTVLFVAIIIMAHLRR